MNHSNFNLVSRRQFEQTLSLFALSLMNSQYAMALGSNEEKSVANQSVMTLANNQFAIRLFRVLSSRASNSKLLFSPFSIESAMLMALEGARGETAAEMGQALAIPESLKTDDSDKPWSLNTLRIAMRQATSHADNKEASKSAEIRTKLKSLRLELAKLNAQSRALATAGKFKELSQLGSKPQELAGQINILAKQVDQYRLNVSNSIWADKRLPLLPSFVQILKQYYGTGGAFSSDFLNQTEAERMRINQWVNDQTEGKIAELIDSGALTPGTAMVLVNAIYFQGTWSKPFQAENTKPSPFYRADGKPESVPMMSQRGLDVGRYGAIATDGSVFETPAFIAEDASKEFGYPKDGFQIAELPYNGDSISMMILLPNQVDGLSRLILLLSSEKLEAWSRSLVKRDFHIQLPRFKMESSNELVAPLKELGMKLAFDSEQANFHGISDASKSNSLFISKVIHRAVIDVNEAGTEAAAATAVLFAPTSAAIRNTPFIPEFNANRPFLFLIRNNQTGLILFMGQYTGT